MYVREMGSGATVVLLHGTTAEPEDWLPLADVLGRRYRVLVPHLPETAAADDLAAVLRERDASTVHAIVGCSTGAYHAFDLVCRAHITADVIASIGGAAVRGARDLRGELRSLRSRVYARVGSFDNPAWSDEVTRSAPTATLDIVFGCGRALLREDGPGTVAAIVRALDEG